MTYLEIQNKFGATTAAIITDDLAKNHMYEAPQQQQQQQQKQQKQQQQQMPGDARDRPRKQGRVALQGLHGDLRTACDGAGCAGIPAEAAATPTKTTTTASSSYDSIGVLLALLVVVVVLEK